MGIAMKHGMKHRLMNRSFLVVLALLLVVMMVPGRVQAVEATVELGTAAEYAVLAGEAITNTGSTVISGSVGGNIGVSPGAAITGFPPGILTEEGSEQHKADAAALQAQADLVIAYDDAAGRTMTSDLTDQDLGGMRLNTGVYFFSSAALLTGTLTLDAEGDPDAVFIFQIGSMLTTASGSKIELVNGARFCRVFWQVGSSATLGTDSEFVGHIFALTSITAQTGATVQGQLLARNGTVTLDQNTITNGVCSGDTSATETEVTESETEVTESETEVTESETEATDVSETSATDETSETTTDEELPQTGESNLPVVIGLTLLSLAITLTLVLRRKLNR